MRQATIPLGTHVQSWAPAPVADEDPLHPGPVAAMSALLDLPAIATRAGEPVPPLWHWLYFLRWPAQQQLGPDGHPRDGRFLPPLPQRRRMFVGGRVDITEPLRLGQDTERVSSLAAVTTKQGRTGELLFVTQRMELRQRGRCCVVEEQDILYRSGNAARPRTPAAHDDFSAPRSEDPWRLPQCLDPTLLFRFSALTANAHRIHYDLPYARDEEGYPGLVVHGPLLALMMLELVRRNAPDRPVRTVSYRLRSPVFAGERLLACGTSANDRADLRIATRRDPRHATAEVIFG